MAPHGNEISLQLRVAVATCRLLYLEVFQEIERKTGVKAGTAAFIMRRAIDRAESEDFNDVLACLGDSNRTGAPVRIEDQSDLSKQVRQAVLKHPRLLREEAVQQENIEISGANKKRKRDESKPQPLVSQSLLTRVAFEHIHEADDGHIVKRIKRKVEPKKPRLNHHEEYKRDNLCVWILSELDKGSIFIASDECYHEIQGGDRKRRRVSVEEGKPAETVAAIDAPVQFTQMHWASCSTEPDIGPQYCWLARTVTERRELEAEIVLKNQELEKDVVEKRDLAEILGTLEHAIVEVCFYIDFYMRNANKTQDENRQIDIYNRLV